MPVSSTRTPPQLLLLAVGIIAALGLAALGAWALLAQRALANRQAEVAVRGAAVMPFDLERTTHIVAGGYAADGSTLASVEAYDPATDRWIAVAPLPAGRNHMGLAAGGYAGPISASAAAAEVWAYDPAADAWAVVAPLPAPRAAHAVVASDGNLYVVGGVGPDARTTLVYEPAVDRWSPLAAIPTEREHLAAAVLDGRIYAIAGRAGAATWTWPRHT